MLFFLGEGNSDPTSPNWGIAYIKVRVCQSSKWKLGAQDYSINAARGNCVYRTARRSRLVLLPEAKTKRTSHQLQPDGWSIVSKNGWRRLTVIPSHLFFLFCDRLKVKKMSRMMTPWMLSLRHHSPRDGEDVECASASSLDAGPSSTIDTWGICCLNDMCFESGRTADKILSWLQSSRYIKAEVEINRSCRWKATEMIVASYTK